MNNQGLDFVNAFKFSDVHLFEKLNNLSINIFEINFYQDQIKFEHNLIPIEISKNDESDRIVDLLINKNHYDLIKKLNVILGDHHKIFIRRLCLNSYTGENMLMIDKPKCENYDILERELQVSHISVRKIILMKNQHILEFMQILKLIMKLIFLL